MAKSTSYRVVRKPLGKRELPPLLDRLAAWVGKQQQGSLGWFDGLTIEPVGGAWAKGVPEKLRADGLVLAVLPDGQRVCLLRAGAQTPVVLVGDDAACRLIAPSVEAFATAWAKSKSGVPSLDHDGSRLVERHGRSAATTRSVPSARKLLATWLRSEGVKAPRKESFDLAAYLGRAPIADFDGRVPRAPNLEAGMLEGKRSAFARYGVWLRKQGHPLAAVIAADDAAMAEPPRQKAVKNQARAMFERYVKAHLAPRYSRVAGNMTHFTVPAFPLGMGFRYGFLEELDSFSWTPAMTTQILELLADDHATWITDLTPRGVTLKDLSSFARLRALRRLNFRWTDIRAVSSLAPLAELRHLQSLDAGKSKITDLSPLKKVPIVQLKLENSAVGDLSPLARHPTLECIDLGKTNVRDVRPLMSCPRLCYVSLWDAKVPAADVEALVAAMKRNKARPTSHQRYLIDGYNRGVTHNDVMWA